MSFVTFCGLQPFCLSAAPYGPITAVDWQSGEEDSIPEINTFVEAFVRWHIMINRISRKKKKILIFLSLKWLSPTCVMLVGFHFIFVTKDSVVIYLHENMRIKQLLLKWLYFFFLNQILHLKIRPLFVLCKLHGHFNSWYMSRVHNKYWNEWKNVHVDNDV